MNPDVFISYAADDRAAAAKVCDFLEAQDIKCWTVDRDLPAEMDRAQAISSSVEACRTMVLLLTHLSEESEEVRQEMALATKSRKVLICLRLEDLSLGGSLAPLLRHRFSIDASLPPLARHLDLLARLVKPLTHKLVPKLTHAKTISGTLPALSFPGHDANVPLLPSRGEMAGLLQVRLNFNRLVVAGYAFPFQLEVENCTHAPLDEVEITIESRALQTPIVHRLSKLDPGEAPSFQLEARATRSGDSLLRIRVSCRNETHAFRLAGSRSIRVNEREANAELISCLKGLLGVSENGDAASDLTTGSAPWKELLQVDLPASPEPLEMLVDYEVSLPMRERALENPPLEIPRDMLNQAPAARVLKLEPLGDAGLLPYQEVHLNAGPSFSLGRSREESDFLTWFWPRNEVHDVKTRRISKKHCTLALTGEEIRVDNPTSSGKTFLDGEEIGPEGAVLHADGLLNFSGVYSLEVNPFPSALPEEPAIANLDAWTGPRTAAPERRGCVRFLSLAPHVLPQNSGWLFTDATFGSSRANGVVLEWNGLAEIQGRFHYHQGVFWIENFVKNRAVQLQGIELLPGLIVPLIHGRTLRLGDRDFRVTLEK